MFVVTEAIKSASLYWGSEHCNTLARLRMRVQLNRLSLSRIPPLLLAPSRHPAQSRVLHPDPANLQNKHNYFADVSLYESLLTTAGLHGVLIIIISSINNQLIIIISLLGKSESKFLESLNLQNKMIQGYHETTKLPIKFWTNMFNPQLLYYYRAILLLY